MKKSSYDNRNFGYILSKDDQLEIPIVVTDTLKEMANYLGISESAVSRLCNRKVKIHFKKLKIERVQLYDYVYVIYESDIYNPLYVAQNINELVKKSGYAKGTIVAMIYDRQYPKISQFSVSCIDLFDYDENYAQYMRECMQVDKVTKSYIEHLEFAEGIQWK